MRKILVVNDDGITAPGLARLARHAAGFGQVWIVAPEHQCSGMSQRIIIDRPLILKEVNSTQIGLEDIGQIRGAFSLDGTPADCVRYAFGCLLPEKPDIVFSGINNGYNAGIDVLYSGTIGAAMQALTYDTPAIAFSIGREARDFSVIEDNIDSVIGKLLAMNIEKNAIWNVNFPKCSAGEVKGMLFDRKPDRAEFTASIGYRVKGREDGSRELSTYEISIDQGQPGSDKRAVQDRYISIGKLRNMAL